MNCPDCKKPMEKRTLYNGDDTYGCGGELQDPVYYCYHCGIEVEPDEELKG